MTADRPTRDGEEQHGGIAYLDHIAATSTNPVLLRAVAETRAELAAAVAAPPAGQACPTLCDDDCDTNCHEAHQVRWKRTHQPEDCPSSPSSPVPDEVREEILEALAGEPLSLSVHPVGREETAWERRVRFADAVFGTSAFRRLLDTAAAVERVEQELKTWEATATDCDTEAAMHHAAGFHHTGNLCRDNAKEIRAYITAVQRALDGQP